MKYNKIENNWLANERSNFDWTDLRLDVFTKIEPSTDLTSAIRTQLKISGIGQSLITAGQNSVLIIVFLKKLDVFH